MQTPVLATSFWNSLGHFFGDLAAVKPIPLLIALGLFALNLTIRSRAYFNTLRAAYPGEEIQWRRIWGAYVAAFGFNNIVPARGGDIIKLFLVHSSVRGSSYPAVASSFLVEAIFDFMIAIPVLIYASAIGVFPSLPDMKTLNAVDVQWLVTNPSRTLFLVTAIAVMVLLVFAVLSVRVKAFWQRVRQGLTIIFDRPRYFREVWLVQLAAWFAKAGAFWFMLTAFGIGANIHNVLLILACTAVATAVPIAPGGAGVQQALIVKVFATAAPATVVAAYSVGQQLAIAVFCFLLGLAALIFIFGFRSFGEVRRAGKEHREAQRS